MKVLKNVALCLFMAVSFAGVSTTAVAESDPGRIAYKPLDAINLVLDDIKAAQAALAEGKSNDEVYALVKQAKDHSKEINANDKVDVARGRANGHLAKAMGALKQKDANTKEQVAPHLEEAAKGFESLKGLL